MTSLVAIGTAVLSLLAPPPAVATAVVPPPGQVVIEVVKMNGSGCRANSAVAAISLDREAFTVTYSEYWAQVGGGAKPKEAVKNCNLDVRVDVPPGYSYAVESAEYRGFGQLESGARGIQKANYYFPGPKPADRSHAFAGPYGGYWESIDTVASADLRWAPCGKSHKLQIDTELQVDGGTSNPATTLNVMAMDSTDGVLSASTYDLTWKRC
jgi:hypothetical protein